LFRVKTFIYNKNSARIWGESKIYCYFLCFRVYIQHARRSKGNVPEPQSNFRKQKSTHLELVFYKMCGKPEAALLTDRLCAGYRLYTQPSSKGIIYKLFIALFSEYLILGLFFLARLAFRDQPAVWQTKRVTKPSRER
jgi:hypothetical protein